MDAFDISAGKRAFGPGRKCLFGVTILIIEDSRSASDALQLFGSALGARMRRAQSLAAAERHLATYRPNVVIVDMGMPDGSGLNFLQHIARIALPVPGLVAISGSDPDEWVDAAKAAGASATLTKPVPNIGTFAEAMLSVLPDGEERRAGKIPELPKSPEDITSITSDLSQIREQLFEALTENDIERIRYCAQFLQSLAQHLEDAELSEMATPLADAETDAALMAAGARLVVQLAQRLGQGTEIGTETKAAS